MSTSILDIPTTADKGASVPVSDDAFDAAASASSDTLPTPGDFCEVCGKELEYSGKGRHPRFCEKHKPARASSNTGSKRSTPRRTWKDADRVESNLVSTIEVIAGGLLFLPSESPLYADGDALYKFGPRIAHELVVLAEHDTRLRTILSRLAAPGKYGPLVFAVGSLLLAIAANHGLLPGAVAEAVAQTTKGGEPTT